MDEILTLTCQDMRNYVPQILLTSVAIFMLKSEIFQTSLVHYITVIFLVKISEEALAVNYFNRKLLDFYKQK